MTDLGGFSMHELFRAEVETHCAALTEGLLVLEQDPSNVAPIQALMRAAHSIKGMALDIGADEFGHQAKSIELALRDGGDFDTAAVAALEAEYRYLKLQLVDWLERTA